VKLCYDMALRKRVTIRLVPKRKLLMCFTEQPSSGRDQLNAIVATLKKLSHVNIATVSVVIDEPDCPLLLFVMEYIPGSSVRSAVRKARNFPISGCWDSFRGLVAGLAHLIRPICPLKQRRLKKPFSSRPRSAAAWLATRNRSENRCRI
jgi:hypothetical protein